MSITLIGDAELMAKLQECSQARFDAVEKKQLTEILNRGRSSMTPRASGELRISMSIQGKAVGYASEYAPHVEYGHRQTPGRFVPAIGKRLKASYVPGQHFLRANVAIQQPFFERDLKMAVQKLIGG